MSKAATILVLGDPGPFRKELLIHKEIEVFWASDLDTAGDILRTMTIDACIVSPDLRDQVEALEDELVQTPCIALQPPHSTPVPPNFASVVEVEKVDSLVGLLSEHTGIQFARYPRADVKAPVTVRHAGKVHMLQSIDLSLSGIAIRSFPPAQVGTRVDLVVELGDRTLHLNARVVRWFEHEGTRAAGLTFIEASESQRNTIATAVKSVLQWAPQQRLSAESLFGDLALEDAAPPALGTMDVTATPMPAFVLRTQDLEIPTLCQVLDGENTDVPEWIATVAKDITAVEAAAARGKACPAWAHRVLRLRLHLAHARDASAGKKLPSALLDEAYRIFEALKEEGAGQSGAMVAQIARIRAVLLRDIVTSHRRLLPVPRMSAQLGEDDMPLADLEAFN